MNIYKINANTKNCAFLDVKPLNMSLFRFGLLLEKAQPINDWVSPKLVLEKARKGLNDNILHNGAGLIFSQKAYSALHKKFTGEIFEASIDKTDEQVYFFKPHYVHWEKVIDQDKSIIEKNDFFSEMSIRSFLEDAQPKILEDKGHFEDCDFRIDQLVFKENIDDQCVFYIDVSDVSFEVFLNPIFASSTFVHLVEENNLTGFIFSPIN